MPAPTSYQWLSSNILAEHLAKLVEAGLLTKADDPSHKQKAIYSLTPMALDLLPVIASIGIWGRKYLPVSRESAANAAALERGGPELLKELRAELRKSHSR